jgi:hypothetical protein
LKLEDYYGEVIALDFDLCATLRLWHYDLKKEGEQAERMGLGPIASAFGAKKKETAGNKEFW